MHGSLRKGFKTGTSSKRRKVKRLGIGIGGLLTLGSVVVFLGSGFSGCMLFSINEQEAAERFRARDFDPPVFVTMKTNPGAIRFASIGEGENTVVFVHGPLGSWSAFIHSMMDEDLRDSARLISVDRPGVWTE